MVVFSSVDVVVSSPESDVLVVLSPESSVVVELPVSSASDELVLLVDPTSDPVPAPRLEPDPDPDPDPADELLSGGLQESFERLHVEPAGQKYALRPLAPSHSTLCPARGGVVPDPGEPLPAVPHTVGSDTGQHASLAVPTLMQLETRSQQPPAQHEVPAAQHLV